MAAISMCLQLIADEMVAKVRWVCMKLGIKKGTEENELIDSTEVSETVL